MQIQLDYLPGEVGPGVPAPGAGATALRPVSYYAHELRPALPEDAFRPASSRLLWLPVHLAVIGLAAVAIAAHLVPWPIVPLLSLAIGGSFAGLTFLAHEAMHGAVVRGDRMRYLLGAIGFFPYALSPRLWIAWHNRIHHGSPNRPGVDPDAYPTLAEYETSALVRFVTDHFAPGRRRLSGWLCLLAGFSVQCLHVLGYARRRGFLPRREHRLAIAESALAFVAWGALAVAVGPLTFAFVYLLPLAVANAIVIAFIMTNHGLSPLTEVNDPLANSLSVTLPEWLEVLTLRFGFHVEHHLFPSMSSRLAPRVRELLRARWPERYQSLPLGRALRMLHRTARVYGSDATLFDPHSGRSWPTLPAAAVDSP